MVPFDVVSSPGSSPDAHSDPITPSHDQPFDHRGSRRLVGKEEWFWYVAAAVTYVVCGIWQKFLLNWFIGPLWLVAFVVVGPAIWDRVRGRSEDASERS